MGNLVILKSKKKIILSILLAFALFLSFKSGAKAAEFDISNFNAQFNIRANNSASAKIEIDFVNNHSTNLITGYTLTVPVKDVTSINAALNNQWVPSSTRIDGDSTVIEMLFKSISIRPNSSAKLSVTFIANNLVKDEFNIKYIYIPTFANNFLVDEVNYDVNFPSAFKRPQYVAFKEMYINNDSRVSIKTSGALFIVWGDYIKADIISNFSITNSKDENLTTVFNLPSQSKKQTVYYKEVDGNLGLIDNVNNYFSLVTLAPKEEKNIDYSARIAILPDTDAETYPSKYNWNLNNESTFGQRIITEIAKGKNPEQKMMYVNQLLKSSFEPYSNEKIDNSAVENIWKRTDEKPKFNSFEYCFFIISAAEHLELEARIDYGYLLLPNIYQSDSRSPHVWCSVKINSKDVMFDPYLEDVLNANYMGETHMDRIKMGTWHYNQPYNNLLGLLSSTDTKEQVIKLATINEFPASEKNIIGILNFPQEVFSGEFYTGDIKVFNSSTSILKIKEIKINDESVLANSKYKNYFTLGLLPRTNNIIHLENLREKNFLFDGKKELNAVIQIEKPSTEDIRFFSIVYFKIDQKLLTLTLLISGVGTVLLGITVWRTTKRPKYF